MIGAVFEKKVFSIKSFTEPVVAALNSFENKAPKSGFVTFLLPLNGVSPTFTVIALPLLEAVTAAPVKFNDLTF